MFGDFFNGQNCSELEKEAGAGPKALRCQAGRKRRESDHWTRAGNELRRIAASMKLHRVDRYIEMLIAIPTLGYLRLYR